MCCFFWVLAGEGVLVRVSNWVQSNKIWDWLCFLHWLEEGEGSNSKQTNERFWISRRVETENKNEQFVEKATQ
jgi:hypothetical protein